MISGEAVILSNGVQSMNSWSSSSFGSLATAASYSLLSWSSISRSNLSDLTRTTLLSTPKRSRNGKSSSTLKPAGSGVVSQTSSLAPEGRAVQDDLDDEGVRPGREHVVLKHRLAGRRGATTRHDGQCRRRRWETPCGRSVWLLLPLVAPRF